MPSKPIRIYDFSQEGAQLSAAPSAAAPKSSSASIKEEGIDFGSGDEEDLFAEAAYNRRIVQRYNKPVKKERSCSRKYPEEEEEEEEEEEDSDEELTELDSCDGRNLIDDEAVEANDDDDDDDEEEESLSDGHEVDSALEGLRRPRHEPSYRVADRHERKVCKNFSTSLLERAVATGHDEEEVAVLAMLIWEELDLTPAKVVDLLARTGCRMGTLLRLGDMSDNVHTSSDEAGANRFSASDVLAFIDRCTAGPEAYLANLSLALEAGLLKLSDKDTVRDIFNQVNPDVLGSDLYARRTCRAIVSNSRTKARCARALCVFTESLPADEACDIVYEALTHDDFLDTTGNMLSFYLQFPKGMREKLMDLFKEHAFIDENGEIRKEEDADEDGNLIDFIVDDDVISLMTGASEEASEEASQDGPRGRAKKRRGRGRTGGRKRGRGSGEKSEDTIANANVSGNDQKRKRIMVLNDDDEEEF